MQIMGTNKKAAQSPVIDKAFILAAGIGTRLRPYTDHCPKPLVKVGSKPIIDHIIDRMVEAGVKTIGINLHYKAEMLRAHLSARTDVQIIFFEETELLDTGGGILNALPLFKNMPFYVSSGDSLWIDRPSETKALERLAKTWNESQTDLSLLLQPIENMHLTQGVGDYKYDRSGMPVRALNKDGDYMFTSVRVCHPRLFDDCKIPVFSFLELMDKAQKEGRLSACIHSGDWHHISTPHELETVDAALLKNAPHLPQERRA